MTFGHPVGKYACIAIANWPIRSQCRLRKVFEVAGFTATFNVPQSLKPGSYSLRAATQAGESATVDLTVMAPSSEASAAPAQARMASGELHEIARPGSAPMLISVSAVALVSITLGLLLVLPRRKVVS